MPGISVSEQPGRAGNAERNRNLLDVAHPTVVGLVSRMEQNGYVTCWPCEDGRNKYVKLTPQAEAIDKDMQRNQLENEEMLLAPLSPEDREHLRDLLLTVAEHLT